MKKIYFFFIAIMVLFSFGAFAQDNDQNLAMASNEFSGIEESVVVAYHVEERINMRFGAQITTYNVSDLSMINTRDLGPNNIRIITPKHAKRKISNNASVNASEMVSGPSIEEAVDERPKSVNIDLIDTYERILDKGYRSEKMIKSVANERFFHGNLTSAAKWYAELFALNMDLEPIYYYRYAQALVAINQLDKSNEMMKIFEAKNK